MQRKQQQDGGRKEKKTGEIEQKQEKDMSWEG